MADDDDRLLRSMWETLVAAASTFGLFGAVNFGLDGDIVGNTFWVVLIPLIPFIASMKNVFTVSCLKSKLWEQKCEVNRDMKRRVAEDWEIHCTIAIMALVPIYIRTSDDEQLIHNLISRGYRKVELAEICSLELRPRSPAPSTVNAGIIAADDQLSPKDVENNIVMDLNIPPRRPATVDDEADIVVPDKEREVLLRLGLAPTYKELKCLRSRNRFETVVMGFQAAGYVLTVVQRMVQNLGTSPVEALVTFLCIIMCLQLLMELYACRHFQRPLRLRLNAHQLHTLSTAPPPNLQNDANLISLLSQSFLLFIFLLFSLVALLVNGLAMFYFLHYVHSHLISALPALLFFLAQVVPLVLSPLLAISLPRMEYFLFAFSVLMYESSIVLSVVSTIMQWSAFGEAANQKAWYAWILPHVSS